MEQLSLKFFWPLTEQNDLDLDYTPCDLFDQQRRDELLRSSVTHITGSNVGWSSNISTKFSFTSNGQERMTISSEGIMMLPGGSGKAGYWAISDKDFRIYRNKKPNILSRKATEWIFGWEWNDEC